MHRRAVRLPGDGALQPQQRKVVVQAIRARLVGAQLPLEARVHVRLDGAPPRKAAAGVAVKPQGAGVAHAILAHAHLRAGDRAPGGASSGQQGLAVGCWLLNAAPALAPAGPVDSCLQAAGQAERVRGMPAASPSATAAALTTGLKKDMSPLQPPPEVELMTLRAV